MEEERGAFAAKDQRVSEVDTRRTPESSEAEKRKIFANQSINSNSGTSTITVRAKDPSHVGLPCRRNDFAEREFSESSDAQETQMSEKNTHGVRKEILGGKRSENSKHVERHGTGVGAAEKAVGEGDVAARNLAEPGSSVPSLNGFGHEQYRTSPLWVRGGKILFGLRRQCSAFFLHSTLCQRPPSPPTDPLLGELSGSKNQCEDFNRNLEPDGATAHRGEEAAWMEMEEQRISPCNPPLAEETRGKGQEKTGSSEATGGLNRNNRSMTTDCGLAK